MIIVKIKIINKIPLVKIKIIIIKIIMIIQYDLI